MTTSNNRKGKGATQAVLEGKVRPLNILIQALQGENKEIVDDFIGAWQRKKGEQLISTRNIIKTAGVIAGYAAYQHIDPWPNSKVDDIIVGGGAILLLALLVIPKSSTPKSLLVEQIALEKLKSEMTPDERKKVIQFLSALSNEQKKRIFEILKTDQGINVDMLKEEDMRKILLEFVGDDNEVEMRKEIEEVIAEMKKFWVNVLPGIKEGFKTADHATAEKLKEFRGFLNKHGVKRYKYQKDGDGKKTWFKRFFSFFKWKQKDNKETSDKSREKIFRTILFLKTNKESAQELLALIENWKKENKHV